MPRGDIALRTLNVLAASAAIGAAAAPPAAAQTPIPLLRGNDVVQYGLNEEARVGALGSCRISGGQGGYYVLVRPSWPGLARPDAAFWGTLGSGQPYVQVFSGGGAGEVPGPIDAAWGCSQSSGHIGYSVGLARNSALGALPAAGFVDAVYLNEALLLREGLPTSPSAARRWAAFRDPTFLSALNNAGQVLVVADQTDAASPPNRYSRLVRVGSAGTSVVLRERQAFGAFTAAQADQIACYAPSVEGRRIAAVVRIEDAPEGLDEGVAIGGLESSGAYVWNPWTCGSPLVREGWEVTMTGGRGDEVWEAFRAVAINQADGSRSTALLSASTRSPTRGGSEVLVRNCAIVLRSGADAGGIVVDGPFTGLRVNNAGDWLACTDAACRSIQALLVNGTPVARTGDRVWLGTPPDGPAGTIRSFRSPNGLDLSSRTPGGEVEVLFTASVEPDGDPSLRVEGLYRAMVTVGPGSACLGDWNGDGRLAVDDIFTFLSAWFAGAADANGDGATTVADIFIFLSAWFAGCD